jgi:Predicted membrane protein
MLLKKNIPFSYVLGKIRKELLVIAVYAAVVAVLYEMEHITRISIPISIPTVLGTVISLLLGFRSNQAYDRWWEARQIWGSIVNDSRNLARQIISFTGNLYEDEAIYKFRHTIIKRQIAWCFAVEQLLRKKPPTMGLEKWISKKELEGLQHYDNVPLGILDQHARDIKIALDKGWINSYQHVELDRTLTKLCDSQGKCERIKNTVFPVTYSLYIHFSLLLFISLLPFGVIEYFGFFEVPLVVAISASFLLIEKMAIHLQDPFENKPTDTPMIAIAKGIEKNLNRMLAENEEHVEENGRVEHYYLL